MGPDYSACIDEIDKIAATLPGMGLVGKAGRGVWSAFRTGMGADAASLAGGFVPKALLGITALQTAAELPKALRAEDPQGLGRTRRQRLGQLVGNIGGSAIAAGALMHAQAPLQNRIANIRGMAAATHGTMNGLSLSQVGRIRAAARNIPLTHRIAASGLWTLPASIIGGSMAARALGGAPHPDAAPPPRLLSPRPVPVSYSPYSQPGAQ